jgi:calcium-dependent protein kinase
MYEPGERDVMISKSLFVTYKTTRIEDEYQFIEEIGKGCFSTVYKAQNRINQQLRAIKMGPANKQELKHNMEVEILKRMTHPNIIEVYEAYQDNKNVYIVSELCSGSELFDVILKRKTFDEEDAARVMHQLLSAINYCHTNGVVHRDIRPENIIVDSKLNLKIVDWTTARFFDKSQLMSVVKGVSSYYLSPEVLSGVYDEKCDIWSIGVILYVLLCGYPPFNGSNMEEIVQKIQMGQFCFPDEDWLAVSDEAKHLVTLMLTYNPNMRPSAESCLSHTWFEINRKPEDKVLLKNAISNMKKFHVERKIQQAALIFMVNHLLTAKDKDGLMEIFLSLDKNGDGIITKEELLQALTITLGEHEAQREIEKTMSNIDIDKNGYIDFNEFILSCIDRKKLINKEKLESTFNMFDLNNNGYISAEEFSIILGSSLQNPQSLMSMLKDVDTNGDTEVSFNEFKLLMCKLVSY